MESISFWNPESTMLESGIHYLESGTHYPESGIHSMESRIQDCPGFPYMGRTSYLPLRVTLISIDGTFKTLVSSDC